MINMRGKGSENKKEAKIESDESQREKIIEVEAFKKYIKEEYLEKENPIWQEALNFIEEAIEKGSEKDWERLVEHNEGEIKELMESLARHDPGDFFKYAEEEGKTWDDYRED